MSEHGVFDAMALLDAIERAAPADAADVLTTRLQEDLGALSASFLIADYSSDILARFSSPRDGAMVMEKVRVHGTLQGRVLRTQRPSSDLDGDRLLIVAPVTGRGEAIGVIEVVFPAPAAEDGAGAAPVGTTIADHLDHLTTEISQAAHLFAYTVVLNRRYTDLFEWGRRSVPLELAAEIQRRLLPDSFTCESAQASIAGWLEPSAAVAGDTFDYSFEPADLYLSLTDAMGHGLASALLATVTVNGLRNIRQVPAPRDLAAMADHVNALMVEHSNLEQFVTGLLFHIDLPSGALRAVNAGHIPFYLMRGGMVEQIGWPPEPAFGMFPETAYAVRHLQLRAGDRLLLVTDGMIDRNAARIDLPAQLSANSHLHPRELVQHLARLVLDACDGDLQDDATVMCLDWHQRSGPSRRVSSGADPKRASGPER
ncbi:PP2C family protein-serine/threonine phosphatase [Parafrankia sp. EUN1f]|uniref:PP2C family protein-serine/threonine phosphatase n=1 Tax=Parafrankia sp. EUN1f TaxID=102897 RepID=UPI001E50CFB8|nr:PP2C family protein-serine/threonine phosphatase [Parafrankia sp. EUN1f]